MKPHAVCIYYFGMTADSSKIKSAFAFLDKVFHSATTTVKLNDLIGLHIHVCNNKGVHVHQLTVWFLDFENHTSWIVPWTSLIHEFTINYRITDLIFFGRFVQVFLFIGSKARSEEFCFRRMA